MDSREPALKWVDFHVLLNALAVLSVRVRDQHPTSPELLDSIVGYLTTGLELQRSGSVDTLDQFGDWLQCMTELRNVTQRTRLRGELLGASDDGDEAVPLDGLRDLVTQALASPQAADARTEPMLLRVQVLPTGATVQLLPDAAGNPTPVWQRELPAAGVVSA